MSRSSEIELKKLCLERMTYAILYSVAMQFILLISFLLFINFTIFHPIIWISNSFSVLFSFYTWFWATPLLSSVLIYGMFLCQIHFTETEYYETRFLKIKKKILQKIGFISTHIMIGFLTGWLYIKFLSNEYKYMEYKCQEEKYCLNEKYLFLILNGIYAGIYYFLKEYKENLLVLKFPVVQLPKYVQIRTQFYITFYQSMIKTLIPTITYIIGYIVLRNFIKIKVIYLLGILNDSNSIYNILFDIKLLFLTWILSSQIISNMSLMRSLFIILLTEHNKFYIERTTPDNYSDITLCEALSCKKIKISYQLASLDLFIIASNKDDIRRKQIFSLSLPGGHPYNWKNLSTICMEILSEFNKEISTSLTKNYNLSTNNVKIRPTASDFAEKLIFRQYNESFGIRNMILQNMNEEQIQQREKKNDFQIGQFYDVFNKKWILLKNYVFNLPGIYYLFNEKEITKTTFILNQTQSIIWILEGLSTLVAHSLKEDHYGVVQENLSQIMTTILDLKKTVDDITPMDMGGKRIDRNYISLKNSIKRSLYQICTIFGDYINDLTTDQDQLKILHNLVHYKEP